MALSGEKKRQANKLAYMRRKVRLARSSPAKAIARYAKRYLVVPPGHRNAGRPMVLPVFFRAFLDDAMQPDVTEAGLFCARKQSKSGCIAVTVIAHLDTISGPFPDLRGWRAGVLSISRAKAGELLVQIEAIAKASGIDYHKALRPDGIRAYRTPAPGRIVSPAGTVEIESADRGAGHSSGFDYAIVDEIGLLLERHRALVAGMRSSVTAKGGKFLALSIWGSGAFVPEMVERRADPGVVVHLHQADPDLPIDDPENIRKANPGIADSIVSLKHLLAEAKRVTRTSNDLPFFRAHHLNLPGSPTAEMLATVDDWRACETDDLPPRNDGRVVVGIDLGGNRSFCAAVAVWIDSLPSRVEAWCACPTIPGLDERGMTDAVGGIYERAAERGDLMALAGRTTPVHEFLRRVLTSLAGQRVIAVGADRFRKQDGITAFQKAGVTWPRVWRGAGRGEQADGSSDVRAFREVITNEEIAVRPNLMFRLAIEQATISTDGLGNPRIEKLTESNRIDLVQAGAIAAGLVKRYRLQRKPGPSFVVAEPAA